jgi:hypothetical protein
MSPRRPGAQWSRMPGCWLPQDEKDDPPAWARRRPVRRARPAARLMRQGWLRQAPPEQQLGAGWQQDGDASRPRGAQQRLASAQHRRARAQQPSLAGGLQQAAFLVQQSSVEAAALAAPVPANSSPERATAAISFANMVFSTGVHLTKSKLCAVGHERPVSAHAWRRAPFRELSAEPDAVEKLQRCRREGAGEIGSEPRDSQRQVSAAGRRQRRRNEPDVGRLVDRQRNGAGRAAA